MNGDVHDQVEDGTHRRDPGQVEECREEGSNHHRIQQCVFLDIARQSEVTVGDQLHPGEKGKHAGDGEDAREKAGCGGDDGDDDRKKSAISPENRTCAFCKRIIPGSDQLGEGQTRGHRKTDRKVHHKADDEGYDDGAADVLLWLNDLVAAVGDRRKALVREDRKRDSTDEASQGGVSVWWNDGRPQRDARCSCADRCEDQQSANLEDSAHVRDGSDDLIPCNVDEECHNDQAEGENRDPLPSHLREEPQRVRAEGPGDKTLVDDHRKRHEKGRPPCHPPVPIGLLEDHRNAAGGRFGIGDLDVTVGTKGADDRRNDECDGKKPSGKLCHLPGECKDPGTDHHPRAHCDGAGEAQASLLVMGLPVIHPVGHGSRPRNRDFLWHQQWSDAMTHHPSPTTTDSGRRYNDCGCQSCRPSRPMVAAVNLQGASAGAKPQPYSIAVVNETLKEVE